jgi:asparagine synthase (glutamine-hydrolysing)
MCGIAGFYGFGKSPDAEALNQITDALSHRGPDGRGIWQQGPVGLGHRRLAILDLSPAGACPMVCRGPDGRECVITYNGEVYNFLELRRELEKEGYLFHSETDTEVVGAAYLRWGKECLLRFNGMWALAIWEPKERNLFLARDRFGVKPLHYLWHRDNFYFASELKAFCALPEFQRKLNRGYAAEALGKSQSLEGTSEETLMEGVKKLLPGHRMEIDREGRWKKEKWWETRDHLPDAPGTPEKQVAAWRELFLDSVRLRLRSDVPVATSLSGGLDSSAVAAGMQILEKENPGGLTRAPRDWRRSFCSVFPGTALDERAYAEETARATGSPCRLTVFTDPPSAKQIEESVWTMEDVSPALAVPVVENYRAMRSQGVWVSLDGHGADEMLGGYGWYLAEPMQSLNDRLCRDFHQTLLPSILRNFDRCSMASGVEVRMPFMDWRLVCLSFALPAELKIGRGYTKWILREAMKGRLPEKIRLRRSKIGFNSPMVDWFNRGLGGLARRVIESPTWRSCRLFPARKIGEEILAAERGKTLGSADWDKTLHWWTCLNLVLWEKMFLDSSIKRPAKST